MDKSFRPVRDTEPGTSEAFYLGGNFFGMPGLKSRRTKGSIDHTCIVCIQIEQMELSRDFYPFVLLESCIFHGVPR